MSMDPGMTNMYVFFIVGSILPILIVFNYGQII
jgi:hypothetical protein